MKILGIETSCDETALSFLEINEQNNSNIPKIKILSSSLFSQIELHKEYGGVFPSLAKREHAKNLIPLFIKLLSNTINDKDVAGNKSKRNTSKIYTELTDVQILKIKEIFNREPELFEAFISFLPKIKKPEIDLISVTSGPGLEPALWVGINFARAISYIWNIPMVAVNHMEGHIVSVLNNNKKLINFPAISLLISGGHTELILVKEWGNYEIIGQTLDDAVGEAFDKVARLLGLPYPGGPEISKLADLTRKNNSEENIDSGIEIKLPRPMLKTNDYNFSFSGLKTAVLYLVKKIKEEKTELSNEIRNDIALEFEDAVTEVLLTKTLNALKDFKSDTLIIGGGVSANKHIRKSFDEIPDIQVIIPELNLTTDNAIMIAIAGYFKSKREEPVISPDIKAEGNLSF